MSLVLGKLETPHREKPSSREVQYGPEIMEGLLFLKKSGQGWAEAKRG